MNDLSVEIYNAYAGTTRLNDPDNIERKIQNLNFRKVYPGGVYAGASFYVPRNILDTWLIKALQRIIIRNGHDVAYEGYISAIEYLSSDYDSGAVVQIVGAVEQVLMNNVLRKWWCHAGVGDVPWKWGETLSATDKCNVDRNNQIKFVPKNVEWATNDTAAVFFTMPTGETVKRVTFDYAFAESGQSWRMGLQEATSTGAGTGTPYWEITADGSGSQDITLGTPKQRIRFFFHNNSGGAQTPASDGSIYGKISNLKVYSETGSITMAEVVRDIQAKFAEYLNSETSYIQERASYVIANGTTTSIWCGSGATLDNLHSGSFTVEGWFYALSTGESGIGHFFAKGMIGFGGWRLYFNSAATSIKVQVDLATTDIDEAWTVTSPLNGWHHFALCYNEASDLKAELFIDGVSQGKTAAGSGAATSDASLAFRIGATDAAAYSFDGYIGWVRVSNTYRYTDNFTPLSRTVVLAVDAATVSLWPMNEGTGAIANDAGVNNNDGEIYFGSWFNAPSAIALEPYIADDTPSAAGIIDEVVGVGDAANKRWAWGCYHSEKSSAPDGEPVIFLEPYPTLDDYDYYLLLSGSPNLISELNITYEYRNIVNWVVVTYEDINGDTVVLTPDDDATLKDDTSISNYGRRAYAGGYDAGHFDSTKAIAYAKRILATYKDPRWELQNSIVLQDYILDKNGNKIPTSLIEPGKRVRILDWPDDQSGQKPTFVITVVDYDNEDRTCTISAGEPYGPWVPKLQQAPGDPPEHVIDPEDEISGDTGGGREKSHNQSLNWRRRSLFKKYAKKMGIDVWKIKGMSKEKNDFIKAAKAWKRGKKKGKKKRRKD